MKFCRDPFWDDFRFFQNSSLPIPTECFSHTVLSGLPCLYFWILLPILILQLRLSPRPALPFTLLFSMKCFTVGLLLIDRFFVLMLALLEQIFLSHETPLADFISPAFTMLTLLVLMIASNECRRCGLSSSGVVFTTWLMFVVFALPEFYAWFSIGSDQQLVSQTHFFTYVAYLAYYPLIVLAFILNCFNDPWTFGKGYLNEKCPSEEASFLDRQFMMWYSKLVSIGHKKPLQVEDIFDLESDMHVDYLSQQWNALWRKQLKSYKERVRNYTAAQKLEDTPLLIANDSKQYGTTEMPQAPADKVKLPSIIGILWTMFKWELLGASFIKLISDLLNFANPVFLSLLITFTEDKTAPWWQGVAFAIGMFSASELRSLMMNTYFNDMYRIAMNVNSTLIVAVYDKTLKLSNAARRQKSQGEIVNLMAIDVDRFRLITPQIQQYWSSPLQVIICMLFLWQTVGYAMFAGLAIMISIIPLNFTISVISKKWQVQVMRLKDKRIQITNEVLSGIKVIKLYAWEPAMQSSIEAIRKQEMKMIRKASIAQTCAHMLNITAPILVAVATFAAYTLTSSEHALTPQVAFVSLTLFNQLRGPLMMVADLFSQTVQLLVSNRRLKEFLTAEELDEEAVDKQTRADFYDKSIEASNASFTWAGDAPSQLSDVNIEFDRGSLVAVVGSVGTGKSSLLMALLGEMEKLRGYVGVRGECAYVPQQPWIQNLSLRENILMGKPYNKVIYDEVIEACALNADIDQLPNGDSTEIGEKGINLSGGQKARVALARAVYQDRDVYLLDDPLSAVDAHVARHIFEHIIGPNGLLAKKTRILVTHGLSFLKETDAVAMMKNGIIAKIGKYEKLLENSEDAEVLKEAELQHTPEENTSEETEDSSPLADDEDVKAGERPVLLSQISRKSRVSKASKRSTKSMTKGAETRKLIEKEEAKTGRVKTSVYLDYFKAMGILKFFLPYAITQIGASVLTMFRSLWLSDWSNDNVPGVHEGPPQPLSIRLGIYALIGFLEVFLLYAAMITFILGAVNASIRLHRPLLHNILRSPLAFFDVTPLGRIINRLGKDMEVVDLRLSPSFRLLGISFLNMIQTILIICISTPLFAVIVIPLIIIYVLFLRYFITSARQLQRLNSLTRSPIYSHFGETIQGAASIRAFNWMAKFKQQNKEILTTNVKCGYYSLQANRWLAVRLEFLGNIVILSAALLAILAKNWNSMSAGVIGLSISYSLNITFMMQMFVRQIAEVETNVVSVERIVEYSETPTEAPWRKDELLLPNGWPNKGRVALRDYSTRYRPGLELVLRNVTINVQAGEKVGVVGRTGAGKSSLALALFRIVEPAGGHIIIDDIDVSNIGLHDLRENLTIIPQDPVLFTGTLRFNIDPTGIYGDDAVWKALEHSNLKTFVQNLPKGLEFDINEGGENISVGQRQLVCLTRALLRKSKILVLDEATAAVDSATDALIQATIRREFNTSTVITIAHRLNTIMDYDRVLVMEKGHVTEFDAPQTLLNDKTSIFYSLAQSAKLV